MIKLIAFIAVFGFLSGCATNNPIGAKYTPSTAFGSVVLNDLKSAESNLARAAQVGAIRYDDPALKCMKSAVNRFGPEDQASFEPELSGVLSLVTVPYIKAQQLAAREPISDGCKQLLGEILVRGLSN